MDGRAERESRNVICLRYFTLFNRGKLFSLKKEVKMKYDMKYIYTLDTHSHTETDRQTHILTKYLNKNMFQRDTFSLLFFLVGRRLFLSFFP